VEISISVLKKNAFSRKICFLKSFFLQKSQIAHDPAYLHPALIITVTSFRACWDHFTGYGVGQVFLLLFLLWKHNRN